VPLKQCLIEPHQPGLANRRTRLDRRKILWSPRETHQHQAGADGATAHQETLVTGPNHLGHFAGQTPELLRI
jgi:hypothetical protein